MTSFTRSSRTSPRQRRRLKVTFLNASSFTSNVGQGGFATERMRVLPAGLRVEGMISSAEREFSFTGRIAWALPGDPLLSLRGRMGVQFLSVDPAFRGVASQLERPPVMGAT